MSEPFLAEIRILGFDFAPRGWAFCDGQILPINQNQALFSLLGTTYGGDGRVNFALPDLRGRVPIHEGSAGGSNHQLGEKSGEETHTLGAAEMPAHSHDFRISTNTATEQRASTAPGSTDSILGKANVDMYGPPGTPQVLDPGAVSATGGGQAHENMMPYLALNFCIALQGIFPSRN